MDYSEVRDELDSVESKDDIKLTVTAQGTSLSLRKTSLAGTKGFFFIGLIDDEDVEEVKALIDEMFDDDPTAAEGA